MLARYLLSSCVCPSVCLFVRHKPVMYRNNWTNRADFWHRAFLPPDPHCAIRKYGYPKKLGYFSLELVPNFGLRKFRHGKSVVLPTKLFDGRACWRCLYDNRPVVVVYYTSVNCNPLTPLCRFVATLLYNLFLYSCAAFGKVSTDMARRAVHLRQSCPRVGLGCVHFSKNTRNFKGLC